MQSISSAYLLSGEGVMPENPVIEFPYKCDNWQIHGFNAITKGDNFLAVVPTSSGKTSIAIYAIMHCVKTLCKRVVYINPIKSLSNEKYNDFTTLFAPYNITVGLMTGDNKINPNADVIIMTAEILHNSLFKENVVSKKQLEVNFVESIGLVIVDEAHYMNDQDRGHIWEKIYVLLDKSIQLVMLSGTIGNHMYFAKWIANCRNRNVGVVHETKRVIPLHHYIFTNMNLIEFIDEKNQYSSIRFNDAKKIYDLKVEERKKKLHKTNDEKTDVMSMVNYLRDNDMLQAIVFSFSRLDCEKFANMVGSINFLTMDEKRRIELMFHKHIESQLNENGNYKFENIAEIGVVKKLLQNGIAYHHSAMIQNLRELIEILMKDNLIKILFATETIAIGVSLPVKTCIFTGYTKPIGAKRRKINISEYRQMAGRAGRRGIYSEGNVIFLPLREFPLESEWCEICIGENPDIRSNFKFDFQNILKIAQTSNLTINPTQLFQKSLMNFQNVDSVEEKKKEKSKLIIQFDQLNQKIDSIQLDDRMLAIVMELLEIETNMETNKMIQLTKKQEIELKNLQKLLNTNNESKVYYKMMKERNNCIVQMNAIDDEIVTCENYVSNMYNRYQKCLEHLGYIVNTNTNDQQFIAKENITISGMICSQISECNCILLTEMIVSGYFSNLSSEDLVTVLSIFCEPIKKGSACGVEILTEDCESYSVIKKIVNRITELIEIEETFVGKVMVSNYDICTDFVEMSYDWACGKTVHEMLEHFVTYEVPIEIFCRNMVKISDIISTIMNIYKMIGTDIEIIPRLEKAKESVMRDIVCTTSLYL